MGKKSFCRGQEIVDLIAAAARPDHGAHIPRIDRHRVETRDIEQHAAVAHMVARPAMPAGTHADRPGVGVGKLDGRDHILFVRRLDNDVGIAIRQIDIAAGEAPRRFIARIAAPKHLADEIRLLLHD
jgi:hypothetical protein